MGSDIGVNVIIPMGGIGSRFSKQGYAMPKPLISIAGRPMLHWILGNAVFEKNDTVFIALRRDLDEKHALSKVLQTKFSKVKIVAIYLDFATRGAAETLYIVTRYMTKSQLARRTISLDCDTIYFSDVLASFRKLPSNTGCSLYFEDDSAEPIYSYVSFKDDSNQISAIAEKVRISKYANTGGYGFGSAELLQKYLLETLDNGLPSAGEYYTSSVIERMLTAGHIFRGVHVSDFVCVGTPSQLRAFVGVLKTKRPQLAEKQTFHFEMNGEIKSVTETELGKAKLAQTLARAGHQVVVVLPSAKRDSIEFLRTMAIPGVKIASPRPENSPNIRLEDDLQSIERDIGWYV